MAPTPREIEQQRHRRQTWFTRSVAIACVVWFTIVALAVVPGPVAPTIAILITLAGVVALAYCHEIQAGGRWIGGVAIAAAPGFLLFVTPVVADENGTLPALLVVAVGSLLVLVSMSVAARVQRRYGDAPDTGGANFYG